MEFDINRIPPIPRVVSEILNIKETDKVKGAKDLEKLIKLDEVLTARVLRAANSPFYARSGKISNLSQAIAGLGFNALKSLVILIISTNYKASKKLQNFHKAVWKHSIFTAFASKYIAKRIREEDSEDCFIAGLLHDFGKLILASVETERYEMAILTSEQTLTPMFEVEQEMFGITHSEIAGKAFKKWNFPNMLVESVMYHHSIITENILSISNIVAYGNILAKKAGYGFVMPYDLERIEKLKLVMNISEEDIKVFENKVMVKDIEEDNFFKTCMMLLENI